jgi:hypothetical protein
MWRSARQRAKQTGAPFTIVEADLPACPAFCPILGVRLEAGHRNHPASPSLDRIWASLGYVPGNLQIISARANRLKSDADPFELMCLAVFMARLVGKESDVPFH